MCCKIFYALTILKIVPTICASRPLFNVFIPKMSRFKRHTQTIIISPTMSLIAWFAKFWLISVSTVRNHFQLLHKKKQIEESAKHCVNGKMKRKFNTLQIMRIDLQTEWPIERISNIVTIHVLLIIINENKKYI